MPKKKVIAAAMAVLGVVGLLFGIVQLMSSFIGTEGLVPLDGPTRVTLVEDERMWLFRHEGTLPHCVITGPGGEDVPVTMGRISYGFQDSQGSYEAMVDLNGRTGVHTIDCDGRAYLAEGSGAGGLVGGILLTLASVFAAIGGTVLFLTTGDRDR